MLKKITITAVILATLSLTGCVSPEQQKAANDARNYIAVNSPIKATSKEQCDLMWQRTQYFITRNAGMKLQIVTDTAIETYNADPNKMGVATGSATRLFSSKETCEIESSISFNLYGPQLDVIKTAEMIKFIKQA